MTTDDDPMFSRSGRTDTGGKLTERIDVPVSEELKNHIGALAVMAGIPNSEWVRRVLERAVYGELIMVRRVCAPAMGGQWDDLPTNGGGR